MDLIAELEAAIDDILHGWPSGGVNRLRLVLAELKRKGYVRNPK